MIQDNEDNIDEKEAEPGNKNNLATAVNELFGLSRKKKGNTEDDEDVPDEIEDNNPIPRYTGFRNEEIKPMSNIPPKYPFVGSSKKESIILEDTVIQGEIQAVNDMSIAGSIKGNVSIEGDLILTGKIYGNVKGNRISIKDGFVEGNISGKLDVTLMGSATVIGDIQAENFVSAGKVKGNVNVINSVSLKSPAILYGNIDARTLKLEEGVIVNGKISITTEMSFEDVFEDIPSKNYKEVVIDEISLMSLDTEEEDNREDI
jgi:cytoskeletal protein CcmA (bactofilin family)